jgi:cephalosporin hydroxylase
MNDRIKTIANYFKSTLPDFECPAIGQTSDEIINTLKIIKQLDPNIILEIGSAAGGFIYLISTVLNSKKIRTIISIDPWSKNTKYEKLFDIYKRTTEKLKKSYPNNRYVHIRGKSQNKDVIATLKRILKNNKIDFLFIDGNHDYKAVLADWNKYKNFVREDGVVAFHDIIVDKGTSKAWKKIIYENTSYSNTEFKKKGIPLLTFTAGVNIEFKKPMVLGVGYIFKKDKLDKKLIPLLG